MRRREPANIDMSDACRGLPLPERRSSTLVLAAAALPVVVILLLYAWRPFRLGFYSDDWLVFLHPEYGSFRSLKVRSLYRHVPGSAGTWRAWWLRLAQLAIGGDPARAQDRQHAARDHRRNPARMAHLPVRWIVGRAARSCRLWEVRVLAVACVPLWHFRGRWVFPRLGDRGHRGRAPRLSSSASPPVSWSVPGRGGCPPRYRRPS